MSVYNPDRVRASIYWIPVIDAFPDAESTVLVSIHGGDEPTWLGFTDGKEWFDACTGGELYGYVTHWAELPPAVEP